ncbi:hypothetical protein AK812_SmicGene3647 [Symbiodinium microadriaticum]|uniref:Uncharacterized protein n=1 Tax=Symbiodinium microadriaticum TaxID=2951 RepID=A0A1Q9EYI1_SYMMI|nr:hypothetical protein AK812_SmicGene3647 [Symbiodinium microadriaticum]
MGSVKSLPISEAECCQPVVEEQIETCNAEGGEQGRWVIPVSLLEEPQEKEDEERPPALESPWLQEEAQESPWLSETGKSEADERPWRANTESTVSISKTDRHTLGKYAEVDVDIVRGISLRGSLSGGGRIWRYSPDTWTPSDRMSLYEMSKKVSRPG